MKGQAKMATIETKDLVKADVALFGSLKSEKDGLAAINKMEIGANDATLVRRMAVLMWGLGKGSNSAPASDKFLVAFNSKFRGGSTGRPIVKEDSSTFKTMASVYSAFAELGNNKSWNTDSAMTWILDNVKGAYSTRGKFIRQIAALTEEPDADTLATMWKAAQNPPKLAGKATALHKAVVGLKDEEAFKPVLLASGSPTRVAYARLIAAAAAFENAVSAGGEGDDELAELMKDAA